MSEINFYNYNYENYKNFLKNYDFSFDDINTKYVNIKNKKNDYVKKYYLQILNNIIFYYIECDLLIDNHLIKKFDEKYNENILFIDKFYNKEIVFNDYFTLLNLKLKNVNIDQKNIDQKNIIINKKNEYNNIVSNLNKLDENFKNELTLQNNIDINKIKIKINENEYNIHEKCFGEILYNKIFDNIYDDDKKVFYILTKYFYDYSKYDIYYENKLILYLLLNKKEYIINKKKELFIKDDSFINNNNTIEYINNYNNYFKELVYINLYIINFLISNKDDIIKNNQIYINKFILNDKDEFFKYKNDILYDKNDIKIPYIYKYNFNILLLHKYILYNNFPITNNNILKTYYEKFDDFYNQNNYFFNIKKQFEYIDLFNIKCCKLIFLNCMYYYCLGNFINTDLLYDKFIDNNIKIIYKNNNIIYYYNNKDILNEFNIIKKKIKESIDKLLIENIKLSFNINKLNIDISFLNSKFKKNKSYIINNIQNVINNYDISEFNDKDRKSISLILNTYLQKKHPLIFNNLLNNLNNINNKSYNIDNFNFDFDNNEIFDLKINFLDKNFNNIKEFLIYVYPTIFYLFLLFKIIENSLDIIYEEILYFKETIFDFDDSFKEFSTKKINENINKFNKNIINIELLLNNNFNYDNFKINIYNEKIENLLKKLLNKENFTLPDKFSIIIRSISSNIIQMINNKKDYNNIFLVINEIVSTNFLINLKDLILSKIKKINNDDYIGFLNDPEFLIKDNNEIIIIENNKKLILYENLKNEKMYNNLFDNELLQNFYYYIMVFNQNKFSYCDNIYNLINEIIKINKPQKNIQKINKDVEVETNFENYFDNLRIETFYNNNINDKNFYKIYNFLIKENIQHIINLIIN